MEMYHRKLFDLIIFTRRKNVENACSLCTKRKKKIEKNGAYLVEKK